MKKSRLAALGAAIVTVFSVTSCEGFKEAMTAHVDVAARAGSHELSVQRLADLLGKSQVPMRKEVAQSIADLWVSYQLLGLAAANGDSLADTTIIDEAMWPLYTQQKTNKYYQIVSESFRPDTGNLEQKYNDGVMLSARHILFQTPQGDTTVDTSRVRAQAEGVLRRTTNANFAALAKQYGSDGTKDQGGNLGVFPPGMMVPDFEAAVKALRPGEIGPLVRTQFGYHIVRRNTYAEAKDEFLQQFMRRQRQVMESTFVADVESKGDLEVKDNAAKVVRQVATNPDDFRDDRTVVGSSTAGNLTAGRVARWIAGYPQPEQLRMQLQQAPDSVMPLFVKSLLRNELFLQKAESAKVALDSTEVKQIREAFGALVRNAWAGLRVAPALLADSAKSENEREALAARRVDDYLERLVNQQEQFVEIPPPLAEALRSRYEGKVNSPGLDRALQAAQKIRATADSIRASQQPKSAVPMPGGQPIPDSGARQ